tara:strand:+ start:6510 stop:7280 length:771 start_codon:yes stop_codon:yes gene_type:complete
MIAMTSDSRNCFCFVKMREPIHILDTFFKYSQRINGVDVTIMCVDDLGGIFEDIMRLIEESKFLMRAPDDNPDATKRCLQGSLLVVGKTTTWKGQPAALFLPTYDEVSKHECDFKPLSGWSRDRVVHWPCILQSNVIADHYSFDLNHGLDFMNMYFHVDALTEWCITKERQHPLSVYGEQRVNAMADCFSKHSEIAEFINLYAHSRVHSRVVTETIIPKDAAHMGYIVPERSAISFDLAQRVCRDRLIIVHLTSPG